MICKMMMYLCLIWLTTTQPREAEARLTDSVALIGDTDVAPSPTVIEAIQSARQLSRTSYFAALDPPKRRVFVTDEGEMRSDIPMRIVVQDPERFGEARAKYQAVLDELKIQHSNGVIVVVPFDLIGIENGPVADRIGSEVDAIRRARELFPENAGSNLLALVYLELALLERDLGNGKRFEELVNEGANIVAESNVNFRNDQNLRVGLPEALNFARPEAALLHLAGEIHLLNGQFDQAQAFLESALVIAPYDPFAWESAALLIGNSNFKSIDRKKMLQQLVNAYPLIWGCTRESFPAALAQRELLFTTQLPILLRRVAAEHARATVQKSTPDKE
jgi:tetratricopeptide (TPR) repeat protein